MSKAELRLSEPGEDRSPSITEAASGQVAPSVRDSYQIRARRFGFLLMVVSGLIVVGVLTIAWMAIGGHF